MTETRDTPPTCSGNSAHGPCEAPVRYEVEIEDMRRRQLACGRHIAWVLSHELLNGETAQVSRVLLEE